MKLITTYRLEHYDISAFGLRAPPRASEARQNCYDGLQTAPVRSPLRLMHNHPSGDPKPSRDDIDMTKEIAKAAEALGIAIHDHLVIGRKGHASFRSLGLF